jgi:hypothetical protein
MLLQKIKHLKKTRAREESEEVEDKKEKIKERKIKMK